MFILRANRAGKDDLLVSGPRQLAESPFCFSLWQGEQLAGSGRSSEKLLWLVFVASGSLQRHQLSTRASSALTSLSREETSF